MALITDLPTQSTPSTSDYLAVDNGSTTSKTTIANVQSSMGLAGLSAVTKTIAANDSSSFTLSNSARGVLFTTGAYANTKGAYIFNVTSTGTVTTGNIVEAAGISLSTGTSTLSIASSSGAVAYATVLLFYGTAS